MKNEFCRTSEFGKVGFGIVRWFNTKRGFGFIETEAGKDLYFHVSDRWVPYARYWRTEIIWLMAPTPEPKVGDKVAYLVGKDVKGRNKAEVWGHAYPGLKNLVQQEKRLSDSRIYESHAGTYVYPLSKRLASRNGTAVDTIKFEASPQTYKAEVEEFDPGKHPQQWKKLQEGTTCFKKHDEDNWGLEEGEYSFEIELKPILNEDDFSGNGCQGRAYITINKRVYHGLHRSYQKGIVFWHRDGTVSISAYRNGTNTDLIQQLLESVGLEVVEKRPITKREAKLQNLDDFCNRNKPSPEREKEILEELVERFGWGVETPETPLITTIVAKVKGVYSAVAPDSGAEVTANTSLALIGIYDPTAVAEWEHAVEKGLFLQIMGFFTGGPPVVWAYHDNQKHLLPPHKTDNFARVTKRSLIDRGRWELLSYGDSEEGLSDFRKRFEELDKRCSTGAIIQPGVNGQVANLIG